MHTRILICYNPIQMITRFGKATLVSDICTHLAASIALVLRLSSEGSRYYCLGFLLGRRGRCDNNANSALLNLTSNYIYSVHFSLHILGPCAGRPISECYFCRYLTARRIISIQRRETGRVCADSMRPRFRYATPSCRHPNFLRSSVITSRDALLPTSNYDGKENAGNVFAFV